MRLIPSVEVFMWNLVGNPLMMKDHEKRLNNLAEESFAYAYAICRKDGRSGGGADPVWVALSMMKYSELIIKEFSQDAITGGGSSEKIRQIARRWGVEIE